MGLISCPETSIVTSTPCVITQNSAVKISSPLKMWQIGCSETSVRNHHYSLRNYPEQRSSQHYLWPPVPPFQDPLSLRNHPVSTIQGVVTNLYKKFHLLKLDNQSQRGVGGSITPKLSIVSRKSCKLFKLRAGQFSVVIFSQVNQGKYTV